MSQNDEIKPEFKTIRISAGTYYKLVEFTGIFSALVGENLSLSQTADMLLINSHQTLYPPLFEMIKDPKQVEQYRENLKKNIMPMFELFRNVKVKE